MTILLNVCVLLLGLFFLIKGADLFVTGASSVAKKLKVTTMVIGLTVVAVGTSLPELAVSISSAIKGSTDLSVANVVGSNMFNMLVCLGVVAIISPLAIKQATKKIDFPVLIAVTLMIFIFSLDMFLDGAISNMISRTDSILLLIVLILYLWITVKNAKKDSRNIFENQENVLDLPTTEKNEIKDLKVWQIVVYILLGLAGVVAGGEMVSSSAQYLALAMGMSQTLVGLTIVALGTSLPELATSIVSAKRGVNDLALGNIIGSNIINITLIIGFVGLITQVPVSTDIIVDLGILIVFTFIFIGMSLTKGKLQKKEGIILLTMYALYMTFAIVRNYAF